MEPPARSVPGTPPPAAPAPPPVVERREDDSPSSRAGRLGDALRDVCDQALDATRSDTALMFVPEGNEVVCIAAVGVGRSLAGWRLPRRRALAHVCFDTTEVLVVDDVLKEPRADHEVWRNLGVRSVACAPVLVGSLVAATLEVHTSAAAAYRPETRETMTAIAHRATRAFRRAVREAGPLARPRLSELPGAVAYHERLGSIRNDFALASLLLVVVGPPLEAVRLHLVRDVLMGQRASDYPFVVDADAFGVIMPDTPLEGARIAARRIGDVLRSRGIGKVGLGTAQIEDPVEAHATALSDALVDLRRPPPPSL